MADTLIKNVSDTAFMVASFRAVESERADALFHDPFARRLAGEHGRKIVERMSGGILGGWAPAIRTGMVAWTVAIRTCIIDDFILSAISRGADAVLNLGAGLDSRPYRMALPESFHWIEVDYPRVIELKKSRLADEKPRCRLERVNLDFADLPARRKLFSEINSRFTNVLVLTEGVVLYLSVENAGSLADDLQSQGSFRHWVVDYFSQATKRYRRRVAILANTPFLFEPGDYYGFFTEHGWSSKEVRYIWDEGKKLKRPMPLPFIAKCWFGLVGMFMSKKRRAALRQSMAYVLFEPTPQDQVVDYERISQAPDLSQ